MNARRDPVERVLDVVVFAPIGAAVALGGALRVAADRLPVDGFQQRLCSALATARGMLQAAAAAPEEPAAVSSADEADLPPDLTAHAAPDVSDLAIEGYDHLAARQVVDRLDGLAAPELDRIERYESANRRRRTVLGKIEQLRS